MKLTILLLKKDSNQDAREGDLDPPPYDLLQQLLVTGTYDIVALAHVPEEIDLTERNRLTMDGSFHLIEEALPVYDGPPAEGVTRW